MKEHELRAYKELRQLYPESVTILDVVALESALGVAFERGFIASKDAKEYNWELLKYDMGKHLRAYGPPFELLDNIAYVRITGRRYAAL